MIESDADRAAMLQPFGVVFAGPRGQFTGVLDFDYLSPADEVAVDSATPRLTAQTADLARCGVTFGVTVTTAAGTFTVRGVQPDGTGMTVLLLEGP